MTLQSFKIACESILLLTVAGSAVYAVRDLHETQVEIRASIAPVGPTITSINSTMNAINRPCGAHTPCGTLSEINKSAVKLQDVTVTLQKQVAQSAKLVDATARNLDTVGDSVKQVSDSLKNTSDAAAITLSQATTDLRTANDSIAQIQPLISHVDALTQSPDLTGTIRHINGLSGNLDAVTGDFRKVADSATQDYLKPKPWWKKILAPAETGLKIAKYVLPW